jgi:heme/copper-type cytochrome/quinol oxidase subunit 2
MSIHDYIEKQRARPERERKRLAVVWTAVAFSVVLIIWAISFREMNSQTEPQADPAAASLNDLKTDFQDNLQTGKDSIQNMMQQVPNQTAPADNPDTMPSDDSLNTDNNQVPVNNDEDTNDKQDDSSVPQLP